ncbi:MAG TPA: hypothetical protein DGG94_02790 [Micromonosporaceae bacterium]|nr:hypothetical protein [Micromonosporaceae bacterium]HCU48746.1 hypothetical protein [Micromonosporaceae bacterium]
MEEVATQFGVSDVQVRRDHLISHILAAIAELDVPVTFFGGTALARTHLRDPDAGARLSEDIDLYGPRRREVAAILDQELPRLLRREFPGTTWDPALSTVRSVDPGQLVSRDGLRVRVQLLDSEGGGHQDLAQWPTERRDVDLRYSDFRGPVLMRVPQLEAFAAMKTVAWADRHAARDLYDLAGLARIGALGAEAADLFHRAMGWRLTPHVFALPDLDWEAQLAHQARVLPTARECLEEVRQGWGL